MHRHNLDLIAEYAQGSLADESRARALVESCATCRTEFETQRSLMNQLAGVGNASLADHERSALHRDVWTELRHPAARQSSRSGAWWSGWVLGGATIAFVAVGLIGVLNNQDDSVVAESSSEAGSALDGEDTSEQAVEPTGDEGAESLSETTLAMMEEAASPRGLSDDSAYKALADDVRSAESSSLYAFDDEPDRFAMSECLVEAGLSDFSPVTGFEAITDLIIAVPPDMSVDNASVAFVDPVTCTVVHLEE